MRLVFYDRVPHRLILLCVLSILLGTVRLLPAAELHLAKQQTVYVPVYSHVFTGPRSRPFQLAATLSIRNVDPRAAFRITTIDYFGTNGKLLQHYLDKPIVVAPLATHYVHIEEKDDRGGFGANFIVKWSADRTINAPLIECVMVGATSGQGISFISPGQEIME